MAKAPRPGAVKTRLVPPLVPEEAAALSLCFLSDMTANIAGVVADSGVTNRKGFVVYTPAGGGAVFERLLPAGFGLLAQRGETLTDRLVRATDDLLGLGFSSLCLINGDSPTLPREYLAAAAGALTHDGDRVVLGPADDGGYYLIGLKRAHHELFAGIDWSTAHVLKQTIERADKLALEVEMLPSWYDVDDPPALRRLCDELLNPDAGHAASKDVESHAGYEAPHTRDYLARLVASKGKECLTGV
ncbi:MAG: TIGR04282 family arsenosugar biosynthesis glycosyltransferase [Pyrinomonadaceae bacterium]